MRYYAPPVTSASIAAALAGADLSLGASQAAVWSGRSRISSGADGTLVLRNNAGTGFTMLQLGGTSSSFPAVRRPSSARCASSKAVRNAWSARGCWSSAAAVRCC